MAIISTGINLGLLLSVAICYFASSGHAQDPCNVAYCATCASDNADACTQCNPSYGPPTAGDQSQCVECPAHCSVCSSNGAGQCDTCNAGYAFDSEGACTAIICEDVNCVLCDTPSTCLTCKPSYGTPSIDDRSQCVACPARCSVCSSNGASQCDVCNIGFAVQPAGTCAAIFCHIPDCVVCDTTSTCFTCRPGYGTQMINGQSSCRRCSTRSGCAQCVTMSQCTRCNSTTLGPKFDGSGECAACAPNCRLCVKNGADKCDACQLLPPYVLQDDKTCAAV
jgi:hypothetical protein